MPDLQTMIQAAIITGAWGGWVNSQILRVDGGII